MPPFGGVNPPLQIQTETLFQMGASECSHRPRPVAQPPAFGESAISRRDAPFPPRAVRAGDLPRRLAMVKLAILLFAGCVTPPHGSDALSSAYNVLAGDRQELRSAPAGEGVRGTLSLKWAIYSESRSRREMPERPGGFSSPGRSVHHPLPGVLNLSWVFY